MIVDKGFVYMKRVQTERDIYIIDNNQKWRGKRQG